MSQRTLECHVEPHREAFEEVAAVAGHLVAPVPLQAVGERGTLNDTQGENSQNLFFQQTK